MNDADRHDQIKSLTELKRVLDDKTADADDIRDAAIRAVNRFDASIAAHDRWQPYSRRGSSDPGTRAEAAALGEARVEHHPAYRGRLRRRIGELIAEVVVTQANPENASPLDRDDGKRPAGLPPTTEPLANPSQLQAPMDARRNQHRNARRR